MQRIYQHLLIGLGLLTLISGCNSATIVGDGQMSEQKHPIQPLRSIKISGNYNVYILQGSQNTAVVRTDNNLQDHVSLDQDDQTLNVYSKGSFKSSEPITITLTVTQLNALDISGNNLIEISALTTPTLRVTLSGHQKLSIHGKTHHFSLEATGDNQIYAKDFTAQNVDIIATGHNLMQIFCQNGPLAIKAQGDNQILYFGKPRHIQQQTAGNTRVTSALFTS